MGMFRFIFILSGLFFIFLISFDIYCRFKFGSGFISFSAPWKSSGSDDDTTGSEKGSGDEDVKSDGTEGKTDAKTDAKTGLKTEENIEGEDEGEAEENIEGANLVENLENSISLNLKEESRKYLNNLRLKAKTETRSSFN